MLRWRIISTLTPEEMIMEINTESLPYPEVKATWTDDKESFTLHCPWIELEVEVEKEQVSEIEKQIKNLNEGVANKELGQFLDFFSDYPISYKRNLKNYSFPSIQSNFETNFEISFSPRDFISQLDPSKRLLEKLPVNWNWSVEEIKSFCQIENTSTHDPLALYTYLRRLRLKTEYEHASNLGIFNSLEKLRLENESTFFKVVSIMIRQTYHITQSCESALLPALKSFPTANAQIQEFTNEEKGHEFFALKSLNSLGISDPKDLELFEETRLSIDLLKHAAHFSNISFANLVGVFEGNSYSEKDALAEVILRSSKPEAANGIQTHYQINQTHEHNRVGENFIEGLGTIDTKQLILATRYSETVVILGNLLSDQINFLIKENT